MGGNMSDGIAALRRKLPEIAVEAVMVVFAVFAAFGVEEWRDERQLRQFAVVARSAVETEIVENLEEFRRTGPALTALAAEVEGSLRMAREESAVDWEGLDLSLQLPRVSTAAWGTAQGSQAAPYFDYGWVIQVARTYEGMEAYGDVRRQLLEGYAGFMARRGRMPGITAAEFIRLVEPLSGSLWLLGQAHREVQGGLARLAE